MLISVYSNQQKFSREINGEQVRIKIIEVCTKLYKSFKGTIYTPHTTGTTLQNFFLGQTLKIKEKQNPKTYFHQNSRAALLLQVTS